MKVAPSYTFGYRFMIRVAAILLILSTTACGFHLRCQNVLSPAFRCLAIDSKTPYGEFESILRQTLALLGVRAICKGQAPYTLHIIQTALLNDVPTIGGSNQDRVYVYYYQVTFELLKGNCEVVIPRQCLTTSKSLIINAGRALESTNQLDILLREMRREIAHMIVNKLNALE